MKKSPTILGLLSKRELQKQSSFASNSTHTHTHTHTHRSLSGNIYPLSFRKEPYFFKAFSHERMGNVRDRTNRALNQESFTKKELFSKKDQVSLQKEYSVSL